MINHKDVLSKTIAVFDEIPFSIAYIDSKYLIHVVNKYFIEMNAGISIGKNIFECIDPNLRDDLRKYVDQTLQSGFESSYELQIEEKWYRTRVIPEIKGDAVPGCIILIYDYEAKKHAEFSQVQTMHNYETLFNSAPIGIFTTRENIIVIANQQFVDIFGYDSIGEVIGKDIIELFAEDVREMILRRSERRINHESEPTSYETVGLRKDGVEFLMHINVDLIDLPEGSTILGFVQDITEFRETREQLYQMQKIEAIGSFAGGIAHDFNNMISIIQSHCDLLLAQASHSDSTLDELNNILEATQNAGALTGQLLTFSKKHIQNPEKINLNLTVRSMSGMIERIIPKNIELNLDLDDQLKDVYVDPSQIGQVIMNLISNAIDAMPDGGKLKISTRNVESRSSIKLSVQDTGIGNPKR
ncbi:MAG: PAS domain S-box protein [Candidatus Kariarchaeaceae archaeon]